MSLVTVTTLYGSDSIGANRSTINSNFKGLMDGINSLAVYLNVSDKTLTGIIGLSLALPTVSTPITQIIFTNPASQSVAGNEVISGSSTVGSLIAGSGGVTSTGHVQVTDQTKFLKSSGGLEINKKVKFLGSELIDATAITLVPGTGYVINTRVVYLDFNANLTLANGEEGQEVFLYNIGSGTVSLQNTNFTSIISGSINLDSKGQVLHIWFKNSKWHVLGSQGGIAITYS